jgi:hypothetical protein
MSSTDNPIKLVEMEDYTTENLEKIPEVSTKRKVSKRILGIACLLGVVVMWVGSSILMQVHFIRCDLSKLQYLFTTEKFNKPLFTTYMNTTLFTLFLIGASIKRQVICHLLMPQSYKKSSTSTIQYRN